MYALRKLVRDATFIASVIGALLLLFTLQSLLSEQFITGDAIQVGKPDDEKVVITAPPKQQLPPQQPLDSKTQCWLRRGLSSEDIAAFGSLLQQTSCTTAAPRKQIQASFEDNCLAIHVGDEAATTLCLEQQQPSFSIELPVSPSSPITVPATKPNYWLAFLILLLGISILFVWGRTDLQYDYYHRRASQDFTRLLPGHDEVQIRYIKPPPTYVKKQMLAEPKILVHLMTQSQPAHTQLPFQQTKKPVVVVSQIDAEQQRILNAPLNKSLTQFNALSQSLCDLIALKKFTEAEQQYPELYRLALDIYSKVSDDNKPRLMTVVNTLHEQLQEVRKAFAVAQDVKDIYQKDAEKTSVQVWKPAPIIMQKEQVHHLDQALTKLRQQLEHTQPTDKFKQAKMRYLH